MPELPRSPGGKWEAREKRIEEERLAATAHMARMRWRRRLLVAIVGATVLCATLGASIAWRSGLTERTVTPPSTPTSTVDAGTSPPSTSLVWSEALAKAAERQLPFVSREQYGKANRLLRALDYPGCKVRVSAARAGDPRELGYMLDTAIHQIAVTAPYPRLEFGTAILQERDSWIGNVILVSCPS